MANKVEIPLAGIHRTINHGPCVLVSTYDHIRERPNVMAVAWNMPCNRDPPMVALTIGASQTTLESIRGTRKFCVNVPQENIKPAVLYVGSVHGRDADKFAADLPAEKKLTPIPSKALWDEKVRVPRIQECMVHLECELEQEVPVGAAIIVIGRVVAASADEGLYGADGYDQEALPMLHHAGGAKFYTAVKSH
eukprot:gnl/Trimastix_PCT/1916.p2 GENE.gnl/Trimastix_PCT/1916~~gnl/Trimastix_PCT/1916.p2  ORF type:complete len:193 (+),score=52.78 gnl/Trimastix_PCT/1916:68-646(+)